MQPFRSFRGHVARRERFFRQQQQHVSIGIPFSTMRLTHSQSTNQQPRRSGTAAEARATAATMGLSEQKHDEGHHHGRGDTRKTRRPSRAAATRGDDSTCPPGSTPTGGDTEGGSRGEGFRYFGEEGRGGARGKVDVDGDLESESQWTVGTVTSLG